jgi:hypothetical protein
VIRHIGHVLGWIVCASVTAALLSCAVPEPNTGDGNLQSGAGVDEESVYQPRLQPGGTSDTARKNLAEVLGGRQGPVGVKYYGRPGINDHARQPELMELLKDGTGYHYFYGGTPTELIYVLFKSIPVLDDGIEVSPRLVFPFADLFDRPIAVTKTEDAYPFMVHLGLVSFHFNDLTQAKEFADSMYIIQQSSK